MTTKNENYYVLLRSFLYIPVTAQQVCILELQQKLRTSHNCSQAPRNWFLTFLWSYISHSQISIHELVTAETCCFVHTTTDNLTNATEICYLSDGYEITRKGGQPRLRNSFIIIRNSFIQFHIVNVLQFLQKTSKSSVSFEERIACCTQLNSKPDGLWHEFGLV